MIWKESLSLIGLSVVLIYWSVGDSRKAYAEDSSLSKNQPAVLASAASQCPTDLSSLTPKMEKALQFIKSASFRNTMLASLQASIPEAIAQADGLDRQIIFLKREIVRQEQERVHAEKVAREGLADPSQPPEALPVWKRRGLLLCCGSISRFHRSKSCESGISESFGVLSTGRDAIMKAVDKSSINLLHNVPEELNQEFVEKIIDQDSVRIERIVSHGHVSPTGFWYDQDEHEWVVVLAGKAQLQIEGREQLVTLGPGDTCNLLAHTKHRVVWTEPNHNTIWLAVFWRSG